MPQKMLKLGLDVQYTQVLDENGKVDKKLEPEVPEEDLRKLYRMMLLVREFDENRLRLQRSGQIGTFAPCKGQEAAQLGAAYAMDSDDWFVPSFRETAIALWRGAKMENDLLYAAGFEEGMDIPEGARDLPIAIPIGTQINHGVGVAWAEKLKGTDRCAVAFIGDGGTSEGDFHEGMNFAAVYQVPLIVMCQNNHWAISVPREKQTKSVTIAQKGFAYQIPSVQVDGNDILGVIRVMREAIERARNGEGPTFIEAITYRMSVHTTADDPSKYRSEDQVKPWEAKDPIMRFRTYLLKKGCLTEEEDEAWREEVKKEVKDAVQLFKDKCPTDLDNMFEHHMEELPAFTQKQYATLKAHWEKHGLHPEEH